MGPEELPVTRKEQYNQSVSELNIEVQRMNMAARDNNWYLVENRAAMLVSQIKHIIWLSHKLQEGEE